MALTHDVRPILNERQEGLGPQVMFAAALLLAVTLWIFIERNFHADLSMPVAASLLFLTAATATLIAWKRGKMSRERVTYWDVAGALTLIGICAAATIDPEQLLRVVESGAAHPDTRVSSNR